MSADASSPQALSPVVGGSPGQKQPFAYALTCCGTHPNTCSCLCLLKELRVCSSTSSTSACESRTTQALTQAWKGSSSGLIWALVHSRQSTNQSPCPGLVGCHVLREPFAVQDLGRDPVHRSLQNIWRAQTPGVVRQPHWPSGLAPLIWVVIDSLGNHFDRSKNRASRIES